MQQTIRIPVTLLVLQEVTPLLLKGLPHDLIKIDSVQP
jgi:hypothetical protein